MDADRKALLSQIANTIRHLSMDGVERAKSGHPGLPLGCAELGAYLYGEALRHDSADPKWLNRDRLVLSAGHGSMWLYSCLHLAGFDLPLEQLKQFRQLHSQTPGHPEYGETAGVEATTGPLGQGVGNAVGMALGLKLLGARFAPELFDAKVFCLAGDGCIMEGVSSEASALAGHLRLDNLVLIYDSNHVCLDGPLDECCSEETAARYRAYGWEVVVIDGHNFEEIDRVVRQLRRDQPLPTLVIAQTVIGKGAPTKAGTSKVHGAPLGGDEVKATKEALQLPQEEFYISPEVRDFFARKKARDAEGHRAWQAKLEGWLKAHPAKREEFASMHARELPTDIESLLWGLSLKEGLAGRVASSEVVQQLAVRLPYLYGGSADLSCSDMTLMKAFPVVRWDDFSGRNLKYGVREFAMATAATGLALTEMIVPFVGTFLTFSDYMRNAIRLAALSRVRVVYCFTHDSIFLGEDGPTHQPVEHYAALRAIPGLQVIRPADSNEVRMAWLAALRAPGPTALLLSRQNLKDLRETKVPFAEGLGRGAYIVKREAKGPPEVTLFATGSELALALEVAQGLEVRGKRVRVVSFPCWELFEQQEEAYREAIVGGELGQRVSIEAGVAQGWHKYIGREGIAISQEHFGASAPAATLHKHFGFTAEAILQALEA